MSFSFFHCTPYCTLYTLYTLYTLPSTQKPKPSAVAIIPQYHFSSPCKLSCSEPQRTRHAVERYPVQFLSPHCSLHSLHSILYTWHSTLYYSLDTPHSTLARHHISHLTLHTPHSMLGDRLYVTPHSTLHVFQTLLPSIFPLLLTIVLQFLSLHSLLHTLHSLHSLHSTLYTEAQTICSCNHSSVSLLIPLQTLLFRTPTNAARRWASEFLHFPTFSACFGGFSFIVYCFFPTFFLAFFHFPPFSPCLQRFSFVFFLPFSCHSSIYLPFLRYCPPFSPCCQRLSFSFFHCTPYCTLYTLYTLYTLPSTQKPKPSAVTIIPQYHFSSPCKLSCSEPQRTRHSVELRSSSIFLRFPPALEDFPSLSIVFFLPFS